MLADPSYCRKSTPAKTTIVTSRPLTLHQQGSEADAPRGTLWIGPTLDLEVLGDKVTIRGRIHAPGKTIKIIARSLFLETVETQDGTQPAELNVDGANGKRPDHQPVRTDVGATGPAGKNEEWQPWTAAFNPEQKPGGRGQSANQIHPNPWGPDDPKLPAWVRYNGEPENNWMHGKHGDNGDPGKGGGAIYVYCGSVSGIEGAKLLVLSAKGGRGGDGQVGQGGAKGGSGGKGSNAEHKGPGDTSGQPLVATEDGAGTEARATAGMAERSYSEQ
jgi:hypothetical protein